MQKRKRAKYKAEKDRDLKMNKRLKRRKENGKQIAEKELVMVHWLD